MTELEELISKGNTLFEEGNMEEALVCFDKILKIKQDNPDFWNKKGVILRSLGRYQEAVECFEKSLKLDPRDKNAS